MDYCIRAELEDQVSPALIRLFQLTWLITPALRKLSTDIQCTRSDIIVTIRDAAMIQETLEAVKDTLKMVNDQLIENKFPGVKTQIVKPFDIMS